MATRPLIELEQECVNARSAKLIDSFIYNPLINRPYMLIRFYNSTSRATKDTIRTYIIKTYDVVSVDYIAEDSSLYVVYDFWKRFPEHY